MIKKILIIFILILGLLVRFYKINNPVADWHSFRQVDTASVTKNLLINFDLFRPTYHDLSNIQSGTDNPKGYRMVEFPIYNLISLETYKAIKIFYSPITIEVASRLVSILFSLLSGILIFLICRQLTNQFLPSFFALIIFLFLPFNIYYSRTILPEPTAVFFMLLTLYIFPKNIFLSSISFCLAILVKPFVGFIIFPVLFLYCLNKIQKQKNIKLIIKLFLFSIISLLPFILWRQWIQQFSEGIPANKWLFNNSTNPIFPEWYKGYNLTFLNKMVAFRPTWFKWLFFERIGKLILASFGTIPLFLGLAYKKNLSQKFCFSLVLGILLYFIFIPQGNIQHDYYQVLIIPSLSIILGFGYFYIYQFLFKSKFISIFSLILIFTFSVYFSWDSIKEYYKINNTNIIEAGKKADFLLPKNSLIIAPYNGDTTFLYQTNRSGWPTEIYDIDKIKKEHSQNKIFFISINYDNYTNGMIKNYKTIFKNDKFIILDLNQ